MGKVVCANPDCCRPINKFMHHLFQEPTVFGCQNEYFCDIQCQVNRLMKYIEVTLEIRNAALKLIKENHTEMEMIGKRDVILTSQLNFLWNMLLYVAIFMFKNLSYWSLAIFMIYMFVMNCVMLCGRIDFTLNAFHKFYSHLFSDFSNKKNVEESLRRIVAFNEETMKQADKIGQYAPQFCSRN